MDPSGVISTEKQLPEIYKPKQVIGFFGYIFLLIVIGFSLIGVLKTFESDLLNYFPEAEYLFELIDEQLEYISESVKNIIVLFNDLINSYYFFFLIALRESTIRRHRQNITINQKGSPLQNPASPVLMLQANPITNIATRLIPIIIVIFSLNFIFLFYLLTNLHF